MNLLKAINNILCSINIFPKVPIYFSTDTHFYSLDFEYFELINYETCTCYSSAKATSVALHKLR